LCAINKVHTVDSAQSRHVLFPKAQGASTTARATTSSENKAWQTAVGARARMVGMYKYKSVRTYYSTIASFGINICLLYFDVLVSSISYL